MVSTPTNVSLPNAAAQPLPEAGATQERTLEAVGCSGLFGVARVSRAALPLKPMTNVRVSDIARNASHSIGYTLYPRRLVSKRQLIHTQKNI